jgi:hypothetical protein
LTTPGAKNKGFDWRACIGSLSVRSVITGTRG